MITDAIGPAVAFLLALVQDHELPHAIPLLNKLPGAPKWAVADRGYRSRACREHVWNLGSPPVIPNRRKQETLSCPSSMCTKRNQVEQM